MKQYECGIKARPGNSIGAHYLYVTTRVWASDAKSAKERAFVKFCEDRNLETYPPMAIEEILA